LRCFVDELIAEGLTILAGKPKKGKSYLALDMSLSIAVGRQAFMKFPTEQAKVLYVSLEDGERRLQRRLLQIQSNLRTPEGLDFLYTFQRLGDGALEALTHYAQYYQIIIVDTIGRILPAQTQARKSLSEYQEFTDALGPIQQLALYNRMAIVMIDHLRKAGADDDLDAIMGSQGKAGAADHALIYSRKGEEKDGVLKVFSRDLEAEKFVLTLVSGHLEFLGKGEVYELDSEQNKIINILEEEARPMGIIEVMKAMGIQSDTHYHRFRKVLQRLYAEDRIGKTKRGLYRLYGDERDEGVPF
jgi:RecA-family ATPase